MIYEYQCNACLIVTEEFLKHDEPKPTDCRFCKSVNCLSQYFSVAPHVSYKGRSWPSKEYKLESQTRKIMEKE